MTVMEFFGCTFIAFGPPFALFVFTIARDPLRIIVLIASGFFWLLSLLVSSILWYAVVPLRETLAFGLVFSVLFQEAFRLLFYKLLRKADDGLQKVSQTGQEMHMTPRDISNKHIMAYVSGLGFGILSGTFSTVNVLADMVGPGTIGIRGDSKYFFVATAFLTLSFVLLHTFWGIIFFNGMDKKQYYMVLIVLGTHMLASCLVSECMFIRSRESPGTCIYILYKRVYMCSIVDAPEPENLLWRQSFVSGQHTPHLLPNHRHGSHRILHSRRITGQHQELFPLWQCP
ncbi:gamma-secretase subunit Aph-1-like isoform X1 [Ostrea edulis]|uniref:gamma-secretase subunit Aph-1-like isoform X1 n=1 Tax=Ostrea edulis TaxID=37623 RepID=UPI0024AFA85F|nr:gamma-secretase subunit Aph-1-like isoform X1 [Ostrea edulis]